jgi:hypothetical protein
MLLIAAIGATFGTHPQVSAVLIDRLILALEYIRWMIIGIVGIAGALLGFALASGFALDWLTFLAALLSSATALALVFWVDHQIQQNNNP